VDKCLGTYLRRDDLSGLEFLCICGAHDILRPEEDWRLDHQPVVMTSPQATLAPYTDDFGNLRLRVAEASGPLQLQWRATVEDNGLPDQLGPMAPQAPIHDLL